MRCPHCGLTDSRVMDSRISGDGVRRRRMCLNCDRRFTTYEHVQMRSLSVVKRDGRRQEFQREKLFASLSKACAKRNLPVGTLEKVVDEIEANFVESGRAEMTSRAIGKMAMDRLGELDMVAYVRYASVYLDFQDIQSFKTSIEDILESREPDDRVPPDQLPMEIAGEDPEPPDAPRRRGRPRRRQEAGAV